MKLFKNNPFRIAACAVLCLIAIGASAQVTNDTTVVTSDDPAATSDHQLIDSLTQAVSQLTSRVDESEKQARLSKIWSRRRYFTFNYVTSQKLTATDKSIDFLKQTADFGAGITLGKTYYVHKNPLGGMVKFGIDWTYIDLTYVKYKKTFDGLSTTESGDDYSGTDSDDDDESLNFGNHQLEYAMAIGPSVTVNPIDYLKVAAYFRYMPTGSLLLHNSEVSFGFVNGFAFGMSASWKALTIGFESRWAHGKYSNFDTEDFDANIDNIEGDYDFESGSGSASGKVDIEMPSSKLNLKNKNFRIYFGFRF